MTSGPGDEPNEDQFPYKPESAGVKPREVARGVGVIVACVLLMCGLFMMFAVVAFAVGLGSSGSNK